MPKLICGIPPAAAVKAPLCMRYRSDVEIVEQAAADERDHTLAELWAAREECLLSARYSLDREEQLDALDRAEQLDEKYCAAVADEEFADA